MVSRILSTDEVVLDLAEPTPFATMSLLKPVTGTGVNPALAYSVANAIRNRNVNLRIMLAEVN